MSDEFDYSNAKPNRFRATLPPEPSESQKRELDRRLAHLDSGGTTESTWEEVEARILSAINKRQS
jgi:putative addiction module component (TIGR02574 family)